jgi:hypothetical protein
MKTTTEPISFVKEQFQNFKMIRENRMAGIKMHLEKMKKLKTKHLEYLKQSYYRHQDFIALVFSIFLSLFSLIMLGKSFFI